MKMSKYGQARYLYPDHLGYFYTLQHRAREIGTDLSYDASGFLEFIEEIGPIPEGMTKPTVGRRDHDKGYVRGNYFWQSLADNVAEMNRRDRKGRPGCTHSEVTRRKMSRSHTGLKIVRKKCGDSSLNER